VRQISFVHAIRSWAISDVSSQVYVRGTVDAANDYSARLGEDRTPDLIEEWAQIHERMVRSLASLDEQAREV